MDDRTDKTVFRMFLFVFKQVCVCVSTTACVCVCVSGAFLRHLELGLKQLLPFWTPMFVSLSVHTAKLGL